MNTALSSRARRDALARQLAVGQGLLFRATRADARPDASARALRLFTDCERRYRAMGDARGMAISGLRRGQALSVMGRPSAALAVLESAKARCDAEGFELEAVKARIEIGTVLRKAGRLNEAEHVLRSCVKERRLSAPNAAGVRLNLANVLIELGRYREALALLDDASERFLSLRETGGAAAAALSSGVIRLSLGLHREAEARFESAARRFRAAHDPVAAARAGENLAVARAARETANLRPGLAMLARCERAYRAAGAHADQARVFGNRAYFLRRLGRTAAAVGAARRALALSRRGGSGTDRGRAWIETGFASLDDDRARLALTASGKALALVGPHGHLALRAESLLLRAGAALRLGRRALAVRSLAAALEIFDREDLFRIRSVLPWCNGEREEACTRALELAVKLGEPALADHVMRSAKTKEFLIALHRDPDGGRRPRPRQGRFIPARRQRVPAGATARVNIWTGNDTIFVHARTHLGERVIAHAGGRLQAQAEAFQEEIALCETDPALALEPERADAVRRIARELYRGILGSVENLLPAPENDDGSRARGGADRRPCLVVSASGPILHIPFGELTSPAGPLDARFRIFGTVETGRAGSRPAARARMRRPRDPLVVRGDVDGLPCVEEEIAAVARLTGARVIDGGKMRSRDFLKAIESADYIHFVGHAVSRDAAPLMSYLRLGRAEVFARDIANVRLARSPVVFLSSCSGAREGGGIGLASAFFAAGAREVIASLWRVPDDLAAVSAEALLEEMVSGIAVPRPDAGLHPFLRSPFVRLIP